MNRKQRERLVIFNQVKQRQMDRIAASEMLGLSLRQAHRLYARRRLNRGACG